MPEPIISETFPLPAAVFGATPFSRFVVTGVQKSGEAVAELLGRAGEQPVRVKFNERSGTLLIDEGDVVRPPRFDELRDLRRVLDAWVRAASRVPDLLERVRVGVTELLVGPAKLEQFVAESVERIDGHVVMRGTVGRRGTAVVTFDCRTEALTIRYEGYHGAPSRVRSLKVSELAGLAQALDSSGTLALEDVREAVQIEFDIVSGERPDPTAGLED